MIKTLLILLSTIWIVLGFSSCACKSNQTRPQIIYKTKIIKEKCTFPNIPEKPKPQKYKTLKFLYDNDYYYCVDLDNAKILVNNWLEYKEWCEGMYNILKTTNDNDQD